MLIQRVREHPDSLWLIQRRYSILTVCVCVVCTSTWDQLLSQYSLGARTYIQSGDTQVYFKCPRIGK